MANEDTISYPFDPTGSNPLNKVINEQHAITPVNFRDYHSVVPRWAPFFAQNLVISFFNPDGSTRTLVEGVDYYLGYQFIQASKACAKPVYGSIQFLDTDLQGVLRLTYQTVGGNWTLSTQQVAELLANRLYNPRITSWEQVVERPIDFPVIDHEWDLVDMVGGKEVVESLDNIRDAISSSTGGGLESHIANKSNPHEVTAAQVGLGNVQNFPIATTAQAQAGTNTTTYMTPATTAAAIASQGASALNTHVQNFNNPHQVNKSQVGLGNVPNYAMATSQEAITGTSTTTFMSPALTAQVVAVVNAALAAHIADKLNPHATTKDQIQLFNVQNYGIATAQQAQDGTDNATYMTPLRVKQAISALASVDLQAHLVDYSNPHGTTKGQVGLGLVDNFATATAADAVNNTIANKFMTPQRVATAITFFIGNDFLNHLNAVNPHNVDSTQVGLGNVPNYTMASTAEAQAGTQVARFMSPALTAAAITAQVGSAFAAHAAATNPHGLTKSDIGLGNVANYPVASDPEASAGVSGTTYLTPRGGALLLNASLGGHLTNTNNPHSVTAAQVGLGDVQNFGIAADADAIAGTSNVLYVTPRTANLAAQTVLSTHSNRTDNPHSVTATQVGLGSVQNFGIATTVEAQQGLSNVKYMTPVRTADAIASQVPALVNVHANRTDNPHAVTAAQVGAYTTQQTDLLLLNKLGVNDIAANSSLLQGNTLAQVIAQANAASINAGLLNSRAADAANTSGYAWVKLGTVTKVANTVGSVTDAKPDLVWLISGGEHPSQTKSGSYQLRLSIRDTAANGYVNYTLTEVYPGPTTGAPAFGYIYDDTAGVATIYARLSDASNPMTIVELNHGGGGIDINYLGYVNPPSPTLMTMSASNAALQAQVDALQTQVNTLQTQLNTLSSDVVSGFNALTTAINNL